MIISLLSNHFDFIQVTKKQKKTDYIIIQTDFKGLRRCNLQYRGIIVADIKLAVPIDDIP